MYYNSIIEISKNKNCLNRILQNIFEVKIVKVFYYYYYFIYIYTIISFSTLNLNIMMCQLY